MENPLLQRVLADIRTAHLESYSEVPITDMDALIVHRLYMHVLDKFEGDLKTFADDGKSAEFDLRIRQGERDKARERRDNDPEPRYAINANFQDWQRRRDQERERTNA